MRGRWVAVISIMIAGCGGDDGVGPDAAVDADTGPADAPPGCGERSERDRPDEPGADPHQIHVVYAIPSDGVDRHLDTDGTIATSIAAADSWFSTAAPGRALRFDRYDGCLDVTFYRMHATDAQIEAQGAYVLTRIQIDMRTHGATVPDKLYAVYYDGASNYACGGGSWPPKLLGTHGAIYLHGVVGGTIFCEDTPITTSPTTPGYWEFAIIHEMVHTLGLVPTCAPHETLSGHASDSPTDLMYSGSEAWQPSVVDIGGDDYFGWGGCVDLSRSIYLEPPGPDEPPA